MRPLVLFLCALAGALAVLAFIRMLVAPGRLAETARWGEPKQEIGDWENEGGSLAASSRAVGSRRDSEGGAA